MKGMVYKDLLLVRKNLLLYLLMGLFFAMTLGGPAVSGMMGACFIALPVSMFSMDKTSCWESYALSLPGGRRGMVGARYAAAIAIIVMGGIYTVILSALFSFGMEESLVSALFILFILCIMLPMLYRYGVNHVGAIVAAAIGLFVFVFYFMVSSEVTEFLIKNALVVLALAAPAALYLSYRVSCAVVEEMEY